MTNNNEYKISKNLCTASKLPASDYVINPYIGCTHRCKYCYAQFMGRFTNHKEPWGTYIEPKKYISYGLPRDLKGKTILIGSVTDAYNPAEKHFRLMPNILNSLTECYAHIEILTKSSLVLRDIDLINKIPDVSVGLSLSNLNEYDNLIIEPGASSAEERLNTLAELHSQGIKTYLFISPYLPGITNLIEIYQKAQNHIDMICVENLNLRGSYKREFLQIIHSIHPDLYDLYVQIYTEKNGAGERYWNSIEEEINNLKKLSSVPVISYMYHNKIKKGARKNG